jgi:hypothetical protein
MTTSFIAFGRPPRVPADPYPQVPSSQNVDRGLSAAVPHGNTDHVDTVRVPQSTLLTVRRAVDLVRCASALCRRGR